MVRGHLESFGLLAILMASFFQLFVESNINEIKEDHPMYRIENKLDNIWTQIGNTQRMISPEQQSGFTAQSFLEMSRGWSGVEERHTEVQEQAKHALYLRGGLFILGSIMVLYARYRNELHESA